MTSVESTVTDGELFDEGMYLAANTDVREAVAAGFFESGWQHFNAHGRAEGRSMRPSSRRDRLLFGLDTQHSRGLEIGPLISPLVTKAEGNILYVDHVDTATLREKYRNHPDVRDVSQIVAVDHVWGDKTLSECLGGVRVDYVLNSHVIEHVPDVVTWLAEIHSVLEPNGSLRMAIPDRRFTFDILRAESTLADALDAHIRRARRPLPRAILDHFLNDTAVSTTEVWGGVVDRSKLKPIHAPSEALRAAEHSFTTGVYQDVHCWVFTPLSFARLCAALARLERLDFECLHLYPTEFHQLEFIAVLRSSNDRPALVESWDATVRRLEAEDALARSLMPSTAT